MKRLELFIAKEGQHHYFIVAEGHARNQHEFKSTDADAMYDQAIAILSADSTFESTLRIFDVQHRFVKGGEMTVSLTRLKSWQARSSVSAAAAA